MTRRLLSSTLGAALIAVIAWLFCRLISPAMLSALAGQPGASSNAAMNPMAKFLLGAYGPSYFSILLSLLFGFFVSGFITYANVNEPSKIVRIRTSLVAGLYGGIAFFVTTILCESAAALLMNAHLKGATTTRHLATDSAEYLEWFCWTLQACALCYPIYRAIGACHKNRLHFFSIVLATAFSLFVVMFVFQALLVIGSAATIHLVTFSMAESFTRNRQDLFPNLDYLAFQRLYFLVYTVAIAVCLGFLFGMVEVLSKKGWLVQKRGSEVARVWPVEDPIMAIGSDPSCRISCEPIDGFAPLHAKLHRYGSEFAITDAGSPGGVIVNGKKKRKVWLSEGDRIRLGGHTFVFTTVKPSPAASQAGNQPISASSSPSLAPLGQVAVGSLVDSFGNRYPLIQGKQSIGRDANCDVCLSWEASVSLHHADIIVNQNEFQLISRGGSDSTKINGAAAAQTATLNNGDIIELGSAKLTFELGKAATLAPVAPA